MRVVFMGSPGFAVRTLKALLASEHEVVAVYTQPDRAAGRGRALSASAVKRVAEMAGLPVLQYTSLWPRERWEELRQLAPDVVVVAAFGLLLPQRILDVPPKGCLNVHPSLLPRHRGASPVANAILAGDRVTGVTVMLLDSGMDTGPILKQVEEPILIGDTTGILTDRLAELGASLLLEVLPQWAEGVIEPVPQDETLATYSSLHTKEEGQINWALPAEQLWRQVRAFQPWPGSYTCFQGRVLKVLAATPLSGGQAPPGTALALPPRRETGLSIGVACGQGVLGLGRVQLEGRRAMTAEEFARGQPGFVGSVLPS